MIEGITTGYEPAFDFPAQPQGPRLAYLLAAVPRAGSTWLSHQLWASGCLGAPLEYLNFKPGGLYGHAADLPHEQARLWRHALATRTSPNGVFGLKSFPGQLHHVQQFNPALWRRRCASCSAQVLPERWWNCAAATGRRTRCPMPARCSAAFGAPSRNGREGRNPPSRPRQWAGRGRMLDQQHEGWQAMNRDLDIVPLVLWFEDALADPAGAVVLVADYLGVPLDLAARVEVPAIMQQAQEGALDWVRRLGERA